MVASVRFHTGTALAQGLKMLFQRLEARLALNVPIRVFLAGGMAVHLYTAGRVTTDVDAEFGAYVGGQAMLKLNLRDAVALAQRAEVE